MLKQAVGGRCVLACGLAIVGAGLLGTLVYAGGNQHADVFVGASQGGRLVGQMSLESSPEVVFLSPVDGILQGFADNNPGFNSSNPGSGFGGNLLEPGVQVNFEVVSFDPAFQAYDSGLNPLHDHGDAGELGGHDLHTHFTWNINTDSSQYDSVQVGWNASYRLNDSGSTGYGDSTVETIFFRPGDVEGATEGDVDQNGSIDWFDGLKFFEVLANPAGATRLERAAADLSRDGFVTRADWKLLSEKLEGAISTPLGPGTRRPRF